MDLMLFTDQFKKTSAEDLEEKIEELYPRQYVNFSYDETGCITFYDFGWHCTAPFIAFCKENDINLSDEIARQRRFDNLWLEAVREAWQS